MEGLENVYDVELVRICQTEVQVGIVHGLWETRLDEESGVQSRRTLLRAGDLHTTPSFPLLCRRAALPPDPIHCRRGQGTSLSCTGWDQQGSSPLLVWFVEAETLDSCAPETGGCLTWAAFPQSWGPLRETQFSGEGRALG